MEWRFRKSRMEQLHPKFAFHAEMAEQDIPVYFHQAQLGCSAQNMTRTGSSYRTELVCANAQFKGNGTAEGTFTSPESFSGQTQFSGGFKAPPLTSMRTLLDGGLAQAAARRRPRIDA